MGGLYTQCRARIVSNCLFNAEGLSRRDPRLREGAEVKGREIKID